MEVTRIIIDYGNISRGPLILHDMRWGNDYSNQGLTYPITMEGIRWVRGHHEADSPAVLAAFTARLLLND